MQEKTKQIIVIAVLGTLIFSFLGFGFYKLMNNQPLGKGITTNLKDKDIIKFKDKDITVKDYKEKKVKRIDDMKKMIANEKGYLGGVNDSFETVNAQLEALDEWMNITYVVEKCWDGEPMMDWDSIEKVNNKLEANQC